MPCFRSSSTRSCSFRSSSCKYLSSNSWYFGLSHKFFTVTEHAFVFLGCTLCAALWFMVPCASPAARATPARTFPALSITPSWNMAPIACPTASFSTGSSLPRHIASMRPSSSSMFSKSICSSSMSFTGEIRLQFISAGITGNAPEGAPPIT